MSLRSPQSLLTLLLVGVVLACPGCRETAVEPGLAQDSSADESTSETIEQPTGDRTTGEDWPCFLGPRRDSTSSETGIVTNWEESPPKILWQFPLHEGYGIGSTSDGRYYQLDAERGTMTLYCLDAATGKEQWKFSYEFEYSDLLGYDSGPRCSPVIHDGRVFIYGVEGNLHALDAKSGEKLWRVDVNEKYGVVQNFFGVGSTPVVYDDLLLVMVGGSPGEPDFPSMAAVAEARPNGSAVVAFDQKTGEEVYRVGDDLASYAAMAWAKAGERDFGLAFCREGLLAFDPKAGTEDFHVPWRARTLESVNAANPVVVGKEVLITETYGPGSAWISLDEADRFGEIVRQDDPDSRDRSLQCHWNTPVYVDGYVYGSSGRHESNAELRCVDWKTKEVKWSVPDLTRSSLLLVDGHFVCLTEIGELLLFRPNTEKFDLVARWTPTDPIGGRPLLRMPAWSAPILSHGLLYVRGADRVLCVELIPQ